MEELEVNPDGCVRFEPNPFKKEKCKTCLKSWKEHKGVISEAHLMGFLQARKSAKDEQERKEKELQEKEKAKAMMKKKRTRTLEDDWLFDQQGAQAEEKAGPPSDDDDDMGFSMFTPQEFASRSAEAQVGQPKAVQIKNLIDFGECNVMDDEDEAPGPSVPDISPSGATSSTSMARPVEPQMGALLPEQATMVEPCAPAMSSRARFNTSPSLHVTPEEELLGEIEHLQQMLNDAKEEKNIQVAIVQDEVVEKRRQIEALEEQRSSDQQELAILRADVTRLQEEHAVSKAEALRLQAVVDEASRQKEEDEHLRSESAAPCSSSEVEALRQEVESLQAKLQGKDVELHSAQERAAAMSQAEEKVAQLTAACEASTAEVESMRDELKGKAEQLASAQEEVTQLQAARAAAEEEDVRLRAQRMELQRQVDSLQTELQGKDARLAASSSNDEELQSLRSKSQQLQQQVDSLQAELQGKDARLATSSSNDEELQSLRLKSHQLQQQVESLQAELQGKQTMQQTASNDEALQSLLTSLRSEVERLQEKPQEAAEAKEVKVSLPPSAPETAPPPQPSSVARPVVREIRSTLLGGLKLLKGKEIANDLNEIEAENADLEDELRSLLDVAQSVQEAAERKQAAVAALETVGRQAPEDNRADELEDEQEVQGRANCQVVATQAAHMLREVRLQAEKQLTWLTKRIQLGPTSEDLAKEATENEPEEVARMKSLPDVTGPVGAEGADKP